MARSRGYELWHRAQTGHIVRRRIFDKRVHGCEGLHCDVVVKNPKAPAVTRVIEGLEKAATSKGFYGELAEAARPYGGVEGYVQHQFEEANRGT